MKSATRRCCTRSPACRCSPMWRRRLKGGGRRDCRRRRAWRRGGSKGGSGSIPGARGFRPGAAVGHGPCRAGGARGDRFRFRRYPGDVRRHAADRRRRAVAGARKTGGRFAVSVMGFRTDNPGGYGRLIEQDGELDRHPRGEGLLARRTRHQFLQQRVDGDFRRTCAGTCSTRSGTPMPRANSTSRTLSRLPAQGLKVGPRKRRFENALGVNTLVELAEAEAIWQRRRRSEAMLAGVTLVAPETVYFSHDTQVAADVSSNPTSSSVRA